MSNGYNFERTHVILASIVQILIIGTTAKIAALPLNTV